MTQMWVDQVASHRTKLSRPPGTKLAGDQTLDSTAPPSVRTAVIGASVVAEWVGYSGDDPLKKPRLRHLFAAFDLNTGKQRGKTAEPKDVPPQASLGLSGGPDGSLAYWMFKCQGPVRTARGRTFKAAKDDRMMFAAGTVSTGKPPQASVPCRWPQRDGDLPVQAAQGER